MRANLLGAGLSGPHDLRRETEGIHERCESLEDAGLVKIDILGLRMLSAVSQASDKVDADIDIDLVRSGISKFPGSI